jgi:hypothetical protein
MVEVLVAISVLLIATVGPMTIAARSLQYAQLSAEQNTAFFLAQEGIEAIFKIRTDQGLAHLNNPAEGSWDWVAALPGACRNESQQCGVDWQDETPANNFQSDHCNHSSNPCLIYFDDTQSQARYFHDGSPDEATRFQRLIFVDDSEPDYVTVRSTVLWRASGSGDIRSVILQTNLHDIYDTTN